MEYEVKIFPEQALVIEKISGEISLEGMIEKTHRLFSNPEYKNHFRGVVDLRNCTTRMSKVELLGFAKLVDESEKFGQSKWAILAIDPMVLGLSQVFQKRLHDPDTIGVFRTTEDAAQFVQEPAILQHLPE